MPFHSSTWSSDLKYDFPIIILSADDGTPIGRDSEKEFIVHCGTQSFMPTRGSAQKIDNIHASETSILSNETAVAESFVCRRPTVTGRIDATR